MIHLLELKKRLLSHNEKTTRLKKEHLTPNQKIHARMISLHAVFEDIEEIREAQDFPEIKYAPYTEPNNVQFEPLLIRNLLRVSISCLQKLLFIVENKHAQSWHFPEVHPLIISELKIAENELAHIGSVLDKKPDILVQDFDFEKNSEEKNPKISIITTSMNLASLLEETIRSVENQDCKNIEYIIIDGASTDGSVDIIQKHKNIILISEKDKGCADALEKGIKLATGKYVSLCFVSDSFASSSWIRKCVERLENEKDISLVWGFSCGINNDSKMVDIAYPEFHYTKAPERENFFEHWLRTLLHYPEVNLCVRRSVLLKHYPSAEECEDLVVDPCLEFVYRFNSQGYLSAHIPIVANFNHIHHVGQVGDINEESGKSRRTRKSYEKKSKIYKWKVLLGLKKHIFVDEHGIKLPIQWNKRKFLKEYIIDRIIKR